jgi:hypothetical protein
MSQFVGLRNGPPGAWRLLRPNASIRLAMVLSRSGNSEFKDQHRQNVQISKLGTTRLSENPAHVNAE